MSNDLATVANTLPAHIRDDSGKAAAMVVSESVPRISLKDAAFRIKKDGKVISLQIGQPIDVVILGIDPPEAKHVNKQFYEGAWSEDANEAPDCYSRDGIRPDPSIAQPYSQTCAICPKNAWGSGRKDDGSASAGKACSDRKNLLVVISGYIDGTVYTLSVPPTSLKALSNYGRELVRYNVNMSKIVTKISVDPDNAKAMMFSYGGYLDEQEAGRMAARAAGPEIAEMIHKALPAPTSQQQPVESQPSLANPAPAASSTVDLNSFEQQEIPQVQVQQPQVQVQQPLQNTASNELDANGVPYDARIHSANKTKVADGTWRPKRGIAKDEVTRVMAEIAPNRAGMTEVAPQNTESVTSAAPSQQSTDSADLDAILSSWGENV